MGRASDELCLGNWNLMMKVRFDDSLPALVDLARTVGKDSLTDALVLRDVTGRLSLCLRQDCGFQVLEDVGAVLAIGLGGYAREGREVIAMPDQAARALFESNAGIRINVEGVFIKLIDRSW